MRTRAPIARRERPVIRDLFEEDPISVDCFAGGAGAAIGSKAATGHEVDIAINHDPIAIAVFQANNPRTECYRADIFSVDPVKACRGRHVRHLHASPDCRHHSRAKGGRPVSESVRALADVVPNWAAAVRPDVITLENVPEFVEWGPLKGKKPDKARRGEFFAAWKAKLVALGYVVEYRVLYAHHYGAPTSRKRLFLVARCDGEPICWPEATHGSPEERKANPKLKLWRTAAECIDYSIPSQSIFDRKRPLAPATLRRVAAGIVRFVLANPRPFIVKVNHGDKGGKSRGAESIDKPLSTIWASQRGHAVVAPTLVQTSYGERKGQAPRVLDLHKPLTTVVAGVKLAPEQIADQYPNAVKVLPFLISYYGSEADIGQALGAPLRTITTRDRFALVGVVVDGLTYVIVDITLRMLEPHELLKAQFGKYAKGYRLDKAASKKDQVRLVGNSVVPLVMEAIVRANLGGPRPQQRKAA